MHVFLICDYDGPIVINCETVAATARGIASDGEGSQVATLASSTDSADATHLKIPGLRWWRRCLAGLVSGIATLATVHLAANQDISAAGSGTSRSA
jgi:hypothetical protein